MIPLRKSLALATLLILGAGAPAHACFLPGMTVVIGGKPYHMVATSSGLGKHWVAGQDPGPGAPPRPPGGPGPGIPIGPIPGFGTGVVFDLVAHSTSLTPVGGGLFNIGFAPDFGKVTSAGVDITLPTLSGGWTYTVNPNGANETFSTGLFSYAGDGMGTDGKQYHVAFSAASSSGVFGTMFVTQGTPGDQFIGVVHSQTITFSDVTASVSLVGGSTNSVSLASVSTTCQTDCELELGSVPEPGTAALACIGLASLLGYFTCRRIWGVVPHRGRAAASAPRLGSTSRPSPPST